MPAETVTAALARVRETLDFLDGVDDRDIPQSVAPMTAGDLRTLLALAEAAVEETRAEETAHAARRRRPGERPRATPYCADAQREAAAAVLRAIAHRRALARGEG